MNFTLYKIINQAANHLFPNQCIQCQRAITHDSAICMDCYKQLPLQDHYCKKCGQNCSIVLNYCGRCLNTPPSFDQCICPYKYDTIIKRLVCDLKYRGRLELAKFAGQLLNQALGQEEHELPEVLIPVPMHTSRLQERGYNHATLIAQYLGKTMRIPVINNALIKSKKTQPQAGLNLNSRKKNLKDSFTLKRKLSAKSVAVIDDVMTSGATVEEIAKILKKNGVDCVYVWTLAHTL